MTPPIQATIGRAKGLARHQREQAERDGTGVGRSAGAPGAGGRCAAPTRTGRSRRRRPPRRAATSAVNRSKNASAICLARGVDQPRAELGDLAADLRLHVVGQQGDGAVIGQRHLGAALGEAGDAALALAADAVAVRRIDVGQLHLPVKRAEIGPILHRGGRLHLVVGGLLQALAAGDARPSAPAGSFSASQTFSRGAGMRRSPVISIETRSPLRGADVTGRVGGVQPRPSAPHEWRPVVMPGMPDPPVPHPTRRCPMTYLVAADLPDEPAGAPLPRAAGAGRRSCSLPGAHNGMAALQAKAAGFEALYLSGAAMTASMGLPDLGVITVDEVCFFIRQVAPRLRAAGAGRRRHRLRRGAQRHAHGAQLRGGRRRRGAYRGPAAAQEMRPSQRQEARRRRTTWRPRSPPRARARRHLVIIARTDAAASEGMDGAVARAQALSRGRAPTRSSPRR